ncbi:MAG: FAD-binding oxidoreductase, partial [Pseudomonadota bacterium]
MSASREHAEASRSALARAIEAWSALLGDGDVITDTRTYNVDTSSFRVPIPAALRPRCVKEVQEIVRIAQRYGVPLSPVSTGRNWGYGSSLPARGESVIVDLSSLGKIRAFDQELGVVTLEPGVTQGALAEYLRREGLPYLVPTTGAGPSCSVLANALERGFGITPITDHFAAVLSLKVVLPDGSLYESFGHAHPQAGLAQAYKWGAGPYLDGLFAQSNLGLVVEANIALRPRPDCCGVLMFVVDDAREADALVPSVRHILSEAGGQQVGAINLMNRTRVESLLHGRQRVARQRGEVVPSAEAPDGAWFGLASLYGTRDYFRATSRLVRRALRGRAQQVRVFTSAQVRALHWIGAGARRLGVPRLDDLVQQLNGALAIVEGRPVDFALPLAYANSGHVIDARDIHPARDGCGLFWYAPIVPLRKGNVAK